MASTWPQSPSSSASTLAASAKPGAAKAESVPGRSPHRQPTEGQVVVAGLEVLNDRPPVEAALAYIARGWPVFPVAWVASPDGPCACRSGASCTHPAKHPLVPGGTSSATTDRSHVLDWWRHWPAAGIGLVTGARSGLAVLDVDPRHGGSGVARRSARFGRRPRDSHRPDRGRRPAPLLAIGDARRVPNTAGRLPALGEAAGLDIRGEGGYVVAPPSSHRSGNRYLWLAGTAGPAPLPAWLQRPSPTTTARPARSACRPVTPRSATWPSPCAGRPTPSPTLAKANAATN